jgi:flagellar hook-associated protein 3 FlgL
MQISTNEFLLGSLGELLTQESNVNQLNTEIATGQTMLDAASDPAGAGEALGLASGINRLNYDAGNAAAATQQLQSGLGVLQQVGTLIDQLQQTALQGANAGNTAATNQALVATAQAGLQQLIQLANSQDADGSYMFAGSNSDTAPFATLQNGQVAFTGDGGANLLEVAPGLTVPVSLSGQSIFENIPAGNNGAAVTAAPSNTGNAYAAVQGVADQSQVTAERLAGTQFEIAFSTGAGGTLDYTITSGIGSPGSASFSASAATVASGSYTAGSGLQFGGWDIAITGTPAAGDQFAVQPAATSSLFQTVQGLIAALGSASPNSQAIENAISNLEGAQNSIQTAQATLGSSLAAIQGVETADSTQSTNEQAQLSNLQSANLPQVLATYSEGVTALQAAELAFSKIQNLSLFSDIQ